mgnify:CR=1 FL=1
MAADGDMYAQRKAWGVTRLCAAARDRAPTEKLVEIEKNIFRNMLGNGFAVPSLKPLTLFAYKIIESQQNGLQLNSVSEIEKELIRGIKKLQRDYTDSPSSCEVAKSILSVSLSALESENRFGSFEEFEAVCRNSLGKFLLDRFCWNAFRTNVMKKGDLSSDEYKKMSFDATQQALPEISELIHVAMYSPKGRLSKRSRKAKAIIKHTPEGLNEELN